MLQGAVETVSPDRAVGDYCKGTVNKGLISARQRFTRRRLRLRPPKGREILMAVAGTETRS
jgi:hypothetical protein